ncbi:MAG: thymidylate kinase [Candidatus Brocadiaceae bacterium]|nr:thymidylate kinase [Candidatus Brocadiaceae bacterium]
MNGQTHAGRMVVFCGIDGSGKATQTRLLAERAEAAGRRVHTISFPRYGQGLFANLIESYLRGDFAPRAADVDPRLAALPYAMDRWQAAPQLRRWLAEDALVICNRYTAANMAHQGAKLPRAEDRAAFYRWVADLEYDALGLPRPDAQILLDLPPGVAAGLVRGRDRQAGQTVQGDIHEADAGYLQATARAYAEVAAGTPGPWLAVQCVRDGRLLSPDLIAEHVRASLLRAVPGIL